MRRRIPCAATALLLAVAAAVAQGGGSAADVQHSVDRAHREIWRRFISPLGTFYDYTAADGRVLVPSADECRNSQPNALGWWTPIENGGFFGGLYLDALTRRGSVLRDAQSAAEARLIAAGLLRLAVSNAAPGFIARGFASDGSGHYIASSSDQTYPWFYGLWRYATSALPDAGERQTVADTLVRVARGLESNGWKMPCDREGFGHFGHWSGGFAGTRGELSGAEPQFDAAVRFLFVLRALHQITGDARWLEQYRQRLAEAPPGSARTRLQICAEGVSYVAPGELPRYPESPPIWTSASTQAGLRALADMESDPAVKQQFQRGLDANAASASRFIAAYRSYDNANTLAFDINWRALSTNWTAQAEIGEAVQLARKQYSAWNRQSPRRVAEADRMRDPLFAAWIVALSGNPELLARADADIRGALTHFEWERLHTGLFFMAECVYWQLRDLRP